MCADKCNSIRCGLGSIQGSVLLYVQVEDLFLTVCCSCWIFPDMARRHHMFLDTEVHCDLHLMRLKADENQKEKQCRPEPTQFTLVHGRSEVFFTSSIPTVTFQCYSQGSIGKVLTALHEKATPHVSNTLSPIKGRVTRRFALGFPAALHVKACRVCMDGLQGCTCTSTENKKLSILLKAVA